MPTFPVFHVEEQLRAYPLALANYQAGQKPFHCTYLAKAYSMRLQYLLDIIDTHDRLRLQSKMHYPTDTLAQEALLEAKKAPGVRQARDFVKVFKYDQAYYWLWYSRKQCQALQTDSAWDNLKRNQTADRVNRLQALQQQWQPHIKYACYTLDDFLTLLDLIDELERYHTLAYTEWQAQAMHMPPKFRSMYKTFLAALNAKLVEEKQCIRLAIFHLVETLAASDNPREEKRFSTHVLPLLQSLQLVPAQVTCTLTHTLTTTAFNRLLAFVAVSPDQTLLQRLCALPLFKARATSPFALKIIAEQQPLRLLPTVLQDALQRQQAMPWFLKLFDWSTDKLVTLFDTHTCFQLHALEQHLQTLEVQQAHWPDSMVALLPLIETMTTAEQALQQEMKRIAQYHPRGLRAWFYSSLTTFIQDWRQGIRREQHLLQQYRLTLATHVAMLAKKRYTAQQPLWPQATLDALNAFFQQTAAYATQASTQATKQSFKQAHATFVEATDYLQRFLQAITTKGAFPKTISVIHGVTAERIDHAAVEQALAHFQANLPAEETHALRLIKDIATEVHYPSYADLDKALTCLFKHALDRDQAKRHFIDALVKQAILPTQNAYQPDVYQLVQDHDAALAAQWRKDSTLDNAEVILFFKHFLTQPEGHEIVFSPLSQPFMLNGITTYPILPILYQYLQAIRWQTYPEQDKALAQLHALAATYLAQYTGSNTTYYTLICGIADVTGHTALSVDYVCKRFDYLVEHHQHALILSMPLAQDTQRYPELKVALQNRLAALLQKSETVWEWSMAEVFDTLGTPEQRQLYRAKLDHLRLHALNALLQRQPDFNAIEQFIDGIQRAKEPDFPASQQAAFNALVAPEHATVWSPVKHRLITAFGDTALKQANARLWLQAFLHNQSLREQAVQTVPSLNTWEAIIDYFGDANTLLCDIENFLTHYSGDHPLPFGFVRTLLLPALGERYQPLLDLWHRQQEAQHLREAMQEIVDRLLDHLANKRYPEAVSQFQLLQEKLANGDEKARHAIIETALKQMVMATEGLVKRLIFDNPVELIFLKNHFLCHIQYDITAVTRLCDEAYTIKSCYDNVKLALYAIISQQRTDYLLLDKACLEAIRVGCLPAQKQEISNLIQSAVAVLQEKPVADGDAHVLCQGLLAFKRLLMNESHNTARDEALVVQYAEGNVKKTSGAEPKVKASDDIASQHALEATFYKALQQIEKGQALDKKLLHRLVSYYEVQLLNPTADNKLFIQRVEVCYKRCLQQCQHALQQDHGFWCMDTTPVTKTEQQLLAHMPFITAFKHTEEMAALTTHVDAHFKQYLERAINPVQTETVWFTHIETLLQHCGTPEQVQAIEKLASLRRAENYSDLATHCYRLLRKEANATTRHPSFTVN